jgi:HrpA-like RNA helicase
MAESPLPEMMRLSLSDLALRIKILNVKLGTSIGDVLSRALDPPMAINVQRAVSMLVEVSFLRVLTSSTYSIPGESFDPFRGNHTHGPAAEQTSY